MSAYDYSSRPSTAGGGGVYTPSNAAPRDDHLEKIQAVQKQADEVADIARQNVNQALSNIEKLEVMEEKSAQLEMHAKDFHKNAVRLRRKFCIQNYKLAFLLFLILAIIGVILYFVIDRASK